jgi:CRISP-associated protein Cas1
LTDLERQDIATLHRPFIAETESPLTPIDPSVDRVTSANIWNPEMAVIYCTEQGTSIYRDYQRFILHVAEKPKTEIPIREVKQIVLFGHIQVSMPVIQTCLQSQIPIFFLSQNGRYYGHLWSEEMTNIEHQICQLERQKQEPFQLEVSRQIVIGKLTNSKQLLLRLNRKRKSNEVQKAIGGIDRDLENLMMMDNLDSLRGYEGIAAARYFPAFGQLITNPSFEFSQRHRQPPTDPINSLLSFGYTLLFNNVLSFIIAEELSPYIGNFHYGDRQKPYLAFDLMEEFRSPIVDSMVLKMVNTGMFKQQDFDIAAETGGFYLNESARRIFLKQFESRMNEEVTHPDLLSPATYRHAIQLQIRRYKRYLLDGNRYEAFLRSV